MQTEISKENIINTDNILNIRNMSEDDWIEKFASGTLRKNKRIGFFYRTQYIHERICYEFGPVFESMPRSYVTFGDAITEEDCHPITEAGYYMERYMSKSIFKEDYFEVKYLIVQYNDGSKKEGVGLVVRKTSCNWIPQGHLVFGIVAEFKNNKWLEALNPS